MNGPLPSTISVSAFDHLNIAGLLALGAVGRLVADPLAFLKGTKTGHPNRRVVDEQVAPLIVGRDKSKALLIVKPLHSTRLHECSSLLLMGVQHRFTNRSIRPRGLHFDNKVFALYRCSIA